LRQGGLNVVAVLCDEFRCVLGGLVLLVLSDKINSMTCASSWNYMLEYYYDARTHDIKFTHEMFQNKIGNGGIRR
jgi:hypothetical protein